MAGRDEVGIFANRPGEFGRRAWRDVARRTAGEVKQDNLSMIAAGVAFYLFLALFPGIAAGISIYGLVADPAEVQRAMSATQGILPAQVTEIVTAQMTKVAQGSGAALGVGALIGILLALWSATAGTKALMTALNIAYEEQEQRGLLRFNGTALLLTFGIIVALLGAVVLVVAIPVVLGILPLPAMIRTAIDWARWPLLAVAMMAGLAIFYRYAPSRAAPRWQWVSYGAVAATLLWLAASALFSWYAANSGSYNETYGSLAAIVILLMWFYISAFVVLLGAELNSEMEHQTARDTTTGAARPIGERRAAMADSVATGDAAAPQVPPQDDAAPRRAKGGSVADLEREIGLTRRRIREDLDALDARLAGRGVAEEALRAVRRRVGAPGGWRDRPLLLGTLGAATGALLAASLARRPGEGTTSGPRG